MPMQVMKYSHLKDEILNIQSCVLMDEDTSTSTLATFVRGTHTETHTFRQSSSTVAEISAFRQAQILSLTPKYQLSAWDTPHWGTDAISIKEIIFWIQSLTTAMLGMFCPCFVYVSTKCQCSKFRFDLCFYVITYLFTCPHQPRMKLEIAQYWTDRPDCSYSIVDPRIEIWSGCFFDLESPNNT